MPVRLALGAGVASLLQQHLIWGHQPVLSDRALLRPCLIFQIPGELLTSRRGAVI